MVGNNYSYFVNCARGLDGFIVGQKEDVPYDITTLMNGYCKAKDENDQEKVGQYLSALIVRYWHVVVMLYQQSVSTRLEFDDIISWVYEGIEKAASYRSWLDSTKEVSKEDKGAEKCINRCITSVRQFWYKHFNQDVRKVNYITSSLDDLVPYSDIDDAPMTVLDTVTDSSETELMDTGREMVQNYLDKNKIFEAIVLDGVLYQDCFMNTSATEVIGQDEEGKDIEITHYNSEFSQIKLKKYLRSINDVILNNFVSTYDVDKELVIATVNYIQSLTKAQLCKKVNRAFQSFKCNRGIKDWLCM